MGFERDQNRKTNNIYAELKDEICCLCPLNEREGSYLNFAEPEGTETEDWYIEKVHHGRFADDPNAYYIKSKEGLYLDIQNEKVQTDANLIMWGGSQSDTQIWRLIPFPKDCQSPTRRRTV